MTSEFPAQRASNAGKRPSDDVMMIRIPQPLPVNPSHVGVLVLCYDYSVLRDTHITLQP